MAFFALGWTSLGTTGMPAAVARTVFAAGVVLTLGFFALAVRMHRSAARLDAPADDPLSRDDRRRAGRRFGLVLSLEWGGCAVIAVVLGVTGHTQALPALIALVVGLHFLPLAAVFQVPGYRVTGVLICASAVAGALTAELGSAASLWAVIPGLGSAVTLYGTGAYLFRTAPAVPPAGDH
ncbi:hypothetical protein [Streptomyces fuscigenes]|uniref:hypothetical protein n=1 Tax=Streptomyces fuscigenes TaxID=1528880 RepID=UPI001F1B1734|nr:hypothetical protein [Streptomyces fuscigenes]MCF3961996.1 hypothetical protein [Streptomyces fuscigenes]